MTAIQKEFNLACCNGDLTTIQDLILDCDVRDKGYIGLLSSIEQGHDEVATTILDYIVANELCAKEGIEHSPTAYYNLLESVFAYAMAFRRNTLIGHMLEKYDESEDLLAYYNLIEGIRSAAEDSKLEVMTRESPLFEGHKFTGNIYQILLQVEMHSLQTQKHELNDLPVSWLSCLCDVRSGEDEEEMMTTLTNAIKEKFLVLHRCK